MRIGLLVDDARVVAGDVRGRPPGRTAELLLEVVDVGGRIEHPVVRHCPAVVQADVEVRGVVQRAVASTAACNCAAAHWEPRSRAGRMHVGGQSRAGRARGIAAVGGAVGGFPVGDFAMEFVACVSRRSSLNASSNAHCRPDARPSARPHAGPAGCATHSSSRS